ncbi:MAG: 50S ribosomal protein L14e [Candidatus Aenigmarchaeota archaeon]|nr:50S ribosomal protein L14e [Candidatus Aenigmarchaeota archaeon]
MASVDVGTVCMKIVGREAGGICCVVKPANGNFVTITGPKLLTGIKRRKCNIAHLEPSSIKVELKEDATDEDVLEAYKKAGVIHKFNLKLPSAGELKGEKTKAEAKEATAKMIKEKKE